MLTSHGRGGMVTAPHAQASEAGLAILREGGTAIEAAVAMAATLAVVYPHMTGIGGDGFWLIAAPDSPPVGIDASGPAGAAVDVALYRRHGLDAIPTRGPLAANTVAGTIAGWQAALAINARWGGNLPLARLLEAPIAHAERGIVVTESHAGLSAGKQAELAPVAGFAAVHLPDGAPPRQGSRLRQPALGASLRRLAAEGLDSFYRGALARDIAGDLARGGSPLALADLAAMQAHAVAPLSVGVTGATLFNLPPPTQGLASLMILALFDRLGVRQADGFDHVHGLVEATKQAFLVRDRILGDPASLPEDPARWLETAVLDRLAARIDRRHALAWPAPVNGGDTVWLGAIDRAGRAVSMIQSLFFEFGSGLLLPETGILWQNRGSAFSLAGTGPRALAPGRKPFHTLNPALARFADGRVMVYGTMGGEGQPQTQAALFSRYAQFGCDLQESISAPRWLLGRTWGEDSVTLKLESRFDPALVAQLRAAGHAVELLAPMTSLMGHAGAVVRHADGSYEGASDPRSDGAAVGL